MGRSFKQKTEVRTLILSRLPATLLLMVGAIFCELLMGIPAGIIAAVRRGKKSDNAFMMMSFVGVSAPQFVVGLLMIYFFAYKLNWFPLGGYGTFAHLVLPALTLGITGGGWYSRMMRSSMIEILLQDYIRTARAKGVSPFRVVMVHGLRNAVIPVIAMIGLDIGFFMAGQLLSSRYTAGPAI